MGDKGKSDNFTVRLPPELKQAVQEEAKRQDRSKAWIVITAIKAYLDKERGLWEQFSDWH